MSGFEDRPILPSLRAAIEADDEIVEIGSIERKVYTEQTLTVRKPDGSTVKHTHSTTAPEKISERSH